ncbi:hypothetical protein [Streptomyces sp. NPDC001744]|uniref:hypothetical protein n=1 Tax=Streptomyces sp. NPDC001744 TaxID=3364606 RepID=UPI003688A2A8
MNPARRLTLVIALLVLAGQAFLSAAYLLWFFPVFAGGIGPGDSEASTEGSGLFVLASLAAGAVVTASNIWALRGMTRTLRGGPAATRPFLVAAVVQFLTLAGSLVTELTPLAATAAFSLLLVLAGLLLESRSERAA